MTTHAPHRLHPIRLWQLLDEPRARTAIRMVAYTILIGAGVGAFGSPPSSLKTAWGALFTDVWAALLILGGATCLAATPRGWWWIERIGITIAGTGLLMYLSVVVTLHVTQPGNRVPQAAVIAFAITLLVERLVATNDAPLDPTSGPDGYHPARRD